MLPTSTTVSASTGVSRHSGRTTIKMIADTIWSSLSFLYPIHYRDVKAQEAKNVDLKAQEAIAFCHHIIHDIHRIGVNDKPLLRERVFSLCPQEEIMPLVRVLQTGKHPSDYILITPTGPARLNDIPNIPLETLSHFVNQLINNRSDADQEMIYTEIYYKHKLARRDFIWKLFTAPSIDEIFPKETLRTAPTPPRVSSPINTDLANPDSTIPPEITRNPLMVSNEIAASIKKLARILNTNDQVNNEFIRHTVANALSPQDVMAIASMIEVAYHREEQYSVLITETGMVRLDHTDTLPVETVIQIIQHVVDNIHKEYRSYIYEKSSFYLDHIRRQRAISDFFNSIGEYAEKTPVGLQASPDPKPARTGSLHHELRSSDIQDEQGTLSPTPPSGPSSHASSPNRPGIRPAVIERCPSLVLTP